MSRYEFSNKNNRLECMTKKNGKKISYFDSDARFILLQLGNDNYNYFTIDKKDKKNPRIRITSDNYTVIVNDCFNNRSLLNKYFINNRSEINSLLDRNRSKNILIPLLGLGIIASTNIYMFVEHDLADKINRDASKENNGKKISSFEEEEINTSNDNFSVGDEDYTLYFDDINNKDFNLIKDKYGSLCKEIGNKYGVSPELLVAMIMQESGGEYSNLMQVEFNYCSDQIFSMNNFITGEIDKFVLTNDKSKYDESVFTIDSDMFEDPYYSVLSGCIMLVNSAKDYDYNIAMAIQGYNYGIGNMHKVLKNASEDLGISIDNLISDKDNLDWLNYRNLDVGDNMYLEHVGRYIDNTNKIFINSFEDNHSIRVSKSK